MVNNSAEKSNKGSDVTSSLDELQYSGYYGCISMHAPIHIQARWHACTHTTRAHVGLQYVPMVN